VNASQRRDWLKILSECFPEWKLEGLDELLVRLDGAAEGGVWEGGLCSRPESKAVAVRYFGADGSAADWRRAAGESLGLPLEGRAPAADGLPWLTLLWDADAGRPARVGPGATLFKPGRYSRRAIEDAALARVLAEFDALCPIRDLVFQFPAEGPGKDRPLPGWSLRLERPLAWPLLARLDMAAPFSAESSRLAFLLLNLRVTELEFDGDRVWAYFRE
jgi:hypothetical protein